MTVATLSGEAKSVNHDTCLGVGDDHRLIVEQDWLR
jgi:hypothetical protein